MTVLSTRFLRLFAFVMGVALFSLSLFVQPIFAQQTNQVLQPKYTGLPGRTVWALTTTGTSTITTFAATDKGLWVSANNGQSWTETSLRNQAVYAIKARRVGNSSTLLAGTDRGVLRSLDNGSTWQSVEVTTGSVGATSNVLSLKKVFDIEISGNFWFAATEKGVFRSNNDGRSWSLVNIDRTADNNEVRGITTDGNMIIVNLWKEGLWRSNNNGNTWSKLTIAGETALCRTIFAHQATNGTVWLAGAVSGNLWRSTNGGNTWIKVMSSISAQRSNGMQAGFDIITTFRNNIIVGNATGLFSSYDNGIQWTRLQIPIQKPISITSDNRSLIYIGQESQQTSVSENTKGYSSLTNSSYGIVVVAIPYVTRINYSPSTATMGQVLNLEVLGENLDAMSVPGYPIYVAVVLEGAEDLDPTTPSFDYSLRAGLLQTPSISANRIAGSFSVPSLPTRIFGINNTNSVHLIALPFIDTSLVNQNNEGGFHPFLLASGGPYALPLNPPNPIPTLTAISPTSVARGGQNVAATITGTNFVSGTRVFFYHPSFSGGRAEVPFVTYNSPTSLSTTWQVGMLALIPSGESVEVRVENPAPGGGVSEPQTLSIVNPAPGAGGLNPIQINAGATSPLGISGTGYFEGSQVFFNGQLKPSTFSNGSLTIQLLPSDIPVAGTYSVVVTNPAPGGGSTQPMTLNVLNPQPYIYAFSPTILGQGQDVTLTLSGGGTFMSGTTVRFYPNDVPLSSTFVNTNTITVTIPGALLPTASETAYTLRAFNPAPGGGASNSVTLTVRNAAPALTSLSPNTLIAASQDVALTLTGSNFLAGAQVLLSGSVPLAATVVNGSTITATLPAQYANAVGTYSIIVRNPDAVGDSQAQMLSVVYPQAQLSAVAPNPVPAQNAALNLTLSGASFISGAQVRILDDATGGQQVNQVLSALVQSASSITATLPQTLAERIGRYRLSVENPAPNSGAPGYITFDVLALTPTLTAIAPTSASMTGSAQALTLTGTNFIALQNGLPQTGTSVEINGQALAAAHFTVQSATQIALTLPVEMLDRANVLRIRVVNPTVTVNGTPQGGGASAERTFTLTYPQPTLNTLTPQVFTLNPQSPSASVFTLSGSQFTPVSRVLVQRTGASSVDTLAASIGTLTGGLATKLDLKSNPVFCTNAVKDSV